MEIGKNSFLLIQNSSFAFSSLFPFVFWIWFWTTSLSIMHITAIQVEGFKSFGEKLALTLDEGVNIFVGRNGSGKSNLVEAVAFVLQATKLDRLSRQHVLHEAAGGGAGEAKNPRLATSVKLTLDNADRRFPADADVVTISRSVGVVKEDSFYLQGKSITKSELMAKLMASGFSADNPYYFVRQGQIAEMATCSDAKRLEVVRDITGVKDYEVAKAHIEAKLEVAKVELDESDKRLEEFNQHLEELNEDLAVFKDYQKLERAKRADEFLLGQGEARKRAIREEALDRMREQILTEMSEAKHGQNEAKDNLHENLKQKNDVTARLAKEEALLEAFKADLPGQQERMGALAGREEAVEVAIIEARQAKTQADAELQPLEQEIRLLEADVIARTSEWKEADADFRRVELERKAKEQEQKSFYASHAAKADFRTEEEAHEWLESSKSEAKRKVREAKHRLERARGELQRVEEASMAARQEMQDSGATMDDLRALREELVRKMGKLGEEASVLDLKLKQLMRARVALNDDLAILRKR